MITITRLLARQLSTVLKKLIPLSERRGLPVLIEGSPTGLLVEARSSRFGLQYRLQGKWPKHKLTVTPELLGQVAGSKPIPVTLAKKGTDEVEASWYEGVTHKQCTCQPETPEKPNRLKLPSAWSQNSPEILTALFDAAETADYENSRYSLGNTQLGGNAGSIVATDGRQAFVQSGFRFEFYDDVLVPSTSVFGCPELNTEESVLIGRTDTHVVVQTGEWTVFLGPPQEGRYPRVHEIIPDRKAAKTTVTFSQSDIDFLTANVLKLPCDDEQFKPVTLDLNGHVTLRARGEGDEAQLTELHLRGSSHSGPDTRVNINRTFLRRALDLGFDSVHIQHPDAAMHCFNGTRDYIFMPLESKDAIKPDPKAIVIESPAAQTPVQTRSTTSIPQTPTTIPMRRRRQFSAPVPQPIPAPVGPPAATNGKTPGVIEQVTQLREVAQDLLSRSTELLRTIKRQKKQHRLMQSTLQSLNQLQNVA